MRTATGNKNGFHLPMAAILGALIGALPLVWNSKVYFRDDMQAQYMPTFYAIGVTLRQTHSIPFLTNQAWFGSNLLGEYQYALFNPVELLFYLVLPSLKTLAFGAAVLAVGHYAILAAGVYVLARALGVNRPYSYVAVAAIAGNNFLYYWYASSWFPAFSSTAYLPWALAFVLKAHESRWAFFGAGIATFLTVTAGWPQTVLVLGLFIAIWSVGLCWSDGIRKALAPAASATLGIAMAIPALLPLLQLGSIASRESGIFNNGFLLPNLGDLLSLSSPQHHGHMWAYSGYGRILNPIFFAAWFILPLICSINWRTFSANWTTKEKVWLLFSALMLLATQGPEHFGPLRYPFRFIPYFHLAIILVFLCAYSQTGGVVRLKLFFGVLALQTVLSLQSDPSSFTMVVGFSLLISVGGLLVSAWHYRPARVAQVMLAVGLISLAFTRWNQPFNPIIADWGLRRAPTQTHSLDQITSSSIFYLSSKGDLGDYDRFNELLFGQMGLSLGQSTINGYSPISHKGLAGYFCFDIWGSACPDAGARLLETEQTTGAPHADLMRVDKIVVERGAYLDRFNQVDHGPWRLTTETARAATFERTLPNAALPGTLSWPYQGVAVTGIGKPDATGEQLRIEQRDSSVAMLVFARPYWPGYEATFNGKPLNVRALADFLVAVDLPAGTDAGDFELRYRPPHLAATYAVSLAALLLLAGGAVVVRHRPREIDHIHV